MADENIVTISEDRLTRLLDAVEKAEERNTGLQQMLEVVPSLQEAFDDVKARLIVAENKATNPSRQYVTDIDRNEARQKAAAQWITEMYHKEFIPGYEFSESFVNEWGGTRASGDIQTGGTDVDGGFLVPELVAPEITRIVENSGIARQICTVRPMGSDTVHLTSRDTSSGKGVKVLWANEGTAPTEDKEEFTRKTLNAKKLVGLTEVSDELSGDASVNFADYLLQVYGEAIGKEEDNQAFVATTPFIGVLGDTSVASTVVTSRFANITADNLIDLQYGVDSNLVAQGVFLMHPQLLKHLRKLKDSNNNSLWAPLAVNQPATILGDPYFTTVAMPSTDGASGKSIIYGDFKHVMIGVRDAFSVAFSSEAGFKEGSRWMRVSQRIAVVVNTPAALNFLINS